MKRIKTLQNQNVSLAAQVRKLQASLARCSGQTAQPSTCLLVLIMSLALVMAPTLRNSPMNSENNEDEGISLSEDGGSGSSLNAGGYFLRGGYVIYFYRLSIFNVDFIPSERLILSSCK